MVSEQWAIIYLQLDQKVTTNNVTVAVNAPKKASALANSVFRLQKTDSLCLIRLDYELIDQKKSREQQP